MPARRTPLRIGARLRRADPGHARPRGTGPSRRTRGLVLARDSSRCVCCGRSVIRQAHDLQHRDARGMRGTSNPLANTAANPLTMLRDHHRRVESRIDPEDNAKGYWLRMGESPLLTPVMVFSPGGPGVTAWPTLDGSYVFEPPVGAASAYQQPPSAPFPHTTQF